MNKPVSIYQVYPRSYSDKGTLNEVYSDIERIASMGFDYLYLLPIHPIGEVGRKGKLGSPYAIRDYYAINPELGTIEDFRKLVSKAHSVGMKIMIDIVINHSACDNPWTITHPEYYLHDISGSITRKISDWYDVFDFDYSNGNLRSQMIDMLKYWVKEGVDGFRCDVASLVPADFWRQAKKDVALINPNMIWLAESTEAEFIREERRQGWITANDSELGEIFDVLYPYDFIDLFYKAIAGNIDQYAFMLNFTFTEYPSNTSRLMCLENHDRSRIADILNLDHCREINWLAFSFCYSGTAFVYAGQEAWEQCHQSLFDKQVINWANRDIEYEKTIRHLNNVRRNTLNSIMDCTVESVNDVLLLHLYQREHERLGVFNVNGIEGTLNIDMKDGKYQNIVNNESILIENHKVALKDCPFLVEL